MKRETATVPIPLARNRDGLDVGWHEYAACVSYNPETWFPTDKNHRRQWDEAQRICVMECPVRDDCLRYALEANEQYGVWGGMTPEQRQKLKEGAA